LEDAQGNVAVTDGRELAARVGEMARLPLLVVLVSCQSGGRQDAEAQAALGPLLAAAGVPAVLAMQGNVSMVTMAAFVPVFFEELRRDGQIDRAMAVARGRVRQEPDAWMPILWMRLGDGRLWMAPDDRRSSDVPQQMIVNQAPNQGAQGIFNAPVYIGMSSDQISSDKIGGDGKDNKSANYIEYFQQVMVYLEQIYLSVGDLVREVYELRQDTPDSFPLNMAFGHNRVVFSVDKIRDEFEGFLSYYGSIRFSIPRNVDNLISQYRSMLFVDGVIAIQPSHYISILPKLRVLLDDIDKEMRQYIE
jgi:hypothetical protein